MQAISSPHEQRIELPKLSQARAQIELSASESSANHEPPHLKQADTRTARIASLSRLMRAMGAVVIVVAALTFLFQRWGSVDHLTRYFSFLAFTGLLSAAGFVCGLKLKEDKGARTFLGIAAAMIPVNFCALGGLGYSRVLAHEGSLRHYHEMIHWVAPSDLAALLTTVIALAVLTVLAFVSFSALLRAEAHKLTAAFVLGNCFLLLPTREANSVALLAALLLVGTIRFDLRTLRVASGADTTEGKVCRALLTLPFLALLARTLNLYFLDLNALFVSATLAALALVLFKYLPEYLESTSAKEHSQALSTIPAAAAWVIFISETTHLPVSSMGELCILSLPFSAYLLLLSFCTSTRLSARFRKAAAYLAVGTVAVGMYLFPGVAAAFLCVLVSLVTAAYAYHEQNRATFIVGILGLLFGLSHHLRYALELYSYSPWVSMALLGTVTVIASSYLERNFVQLTERLAQLRLRLSK
jgi:hypothetical protein